jgi:hypothetical protein
MSWRTPLTKLANFADAGLRGLKAFSAYAWVPILIAAVVSAVLAYRNLSLQQCGNRPEITFNRLELHNPYDDDGIRRCFCSRAINIRATGGCATHFR